MAAHRAEGVPLIRPLHRSAHLGSSVSVADPPPSNEMTGHRGKGLAHRHRASPTPHPLGCHRGRRSFPKKCELAAKMYYRVATDPQTLAPQKFTGEFRRLHGVIERLVLPRRV